jgi:hypothetical protein
MTAPNEGNKMANEIKNCDKNGATLTLSFSKKEDFVDVKKVISRIIFSRKNDPDSPGPVLFGCYVNDKQCTLIIRENEKGGTSEFFSLMKSNHIKIKEEHNPSLNEKTPLLIKKTV